jgi:transcriptional regulator with XRE-family HTH domain
MPLRKPEDIFVERLDELLRDREAKAIAERSGISHHTLSKWRNRKIPANPGLDSLARLARALGVPIVYLISDGVYEPPYPPGAVENLMRADEQLQHASSVARRAIADMLKKP